MKIAVAKRVLLLDGADGNYLILDPDFPGCIGQGEKEPAGLNKSLYKIQAARSSTNAVGFCISYREIMWPDVPWGRTPEGANIILKIESPDKDQVAKTPIISGEECSQKLEKLGFQRIATPDAIPGHLHFCFQNHFFIEDKSIGALVSIPKVPYLDRLVLIYILATLRVTFEKFVNPGN